MAASRVIEREGVINLTIEKVAKEAGISKGGLLYHFPNKELLVTTLFLGYLNSYIKGTEKRAKHDALENGKWTRAFLLESIRDSEYYPMVGADLMSNCLTHPDMYAEMRTAYEDWQRHIENDGIDPVKATIVRLAADGLYFMDLFRLSPLKDDLREKVIERLMNLTKEK
nr:TetR/AcrR family transcriptional regulator [Bacillus sp. REN3]